MGGSCSMILHLGYFATVHAMVEPRCRSKRSESTAHRASLEIWVLGCRLQPHPSRISSRYLFCLSAMFLPPAGYISFFFRVLFRTSKTNVLASIVSRGRDLTKSRPLAYSPSPTDFSAPPSLPCAPQVLVQGSNWKRLKARSALGLGSASMILDTATSISI